MGFSSMAVWDLIPWCCPLGQVAEYQDSADFPHLLGHRITCSYSSAGCSVAPQHPFLHLRAEISRSQPKHKTRQAFRLPNNLKFHGWKTPFLPSLKEMNLYALPSTGTQIQIPNSHKGRKGRIRKGLMILVQ